MTDPVIRFTSEPPLGVTVWHDGQAYEIVGVEPYVNRLGEASNLVRWRSNCADCGVEFEMTYGRQVGNFNRRCDAHKAPGRRA